MSTFKTWFTVLGEDNREKRELLIGILHKLRDTEAATIVIGYFKDRDCFVIEVENEDPISDLLYEIIDLDLYNVGIIGPDLNSLDCLRIPLDQFVNFDPDNSIPPQQS